MPKLKIEMNFCRRCGTKLAHKGGIAYVCERNHPAFISSSPCAGLILINDKNEALILVRGIEPGKGKLDIPGGFCDGAESTENAVVREAREEVGLEPSDYTTPEYVVNSIDTYEYAGEVLPNSGTIYVAQMITNKKPVPADDAASVEWIPLSDIDLDKIYFPTVRIALAKVVAAKTKVGTKAS